MHLCWMETSILKNQEKKYSKNFLKLSLVFTLRKKKLYALYASTVTTALSVDAVFSF